MKLQEKDLGNKKYTKEDLEQAIKRTTIYEASKIFGIPYVRLHSRIKGMRGAKKEEKDRPITVPIKEETRLAEK